MLTFEQEPQTVAPPTLIHPDDLPLWHRDRDVLAQAPLPKWRFAEMPPWPDSPTPPDVTVRLNWLTVELERVTALLIDVTAVKDAAQSLYADKLDDAKEQHGGLKATDRDRRARIQTRLHRLRMEKAAALETMLKTRLKILEQQSDLARTYAVEARSAYERPVTPGPARAPH